MADKPTLRARGGMRRVASNSKLSVATFGTVEPGQDITNGRPVTINLPSRYIPLLGLAMASLTIFGSVAMNRYYGHDIGGIPWPYISDTAKDAPQSGLFAYGLTVVSAIIGIVTVINYAKISIDLDLSASNAENDSGDMVRPGSSNIARQTLSSESNANQEKSCCGRSRNRLALIAGFVAAPNLGLLACFDTQRSPDLHLLFVLLFFLPCVVYLFAIKSVYELLLARAERSKSDGSMADDAHSFKSYTSLRTSLAWKRLICNIFLVSVTLYLPVGMYFVTDWYDYSKDLVVHTCRAVAQHVSVLCLCAFFGSMYFDFGDLEFIVVQG